MYALWTELLLEQPHKLDELVLRGLRKAMLMVFAAYIDGVRVQI
jgi:hypothetical protein